MGPILCPSRQARRLTKWRLWLDEFLASVPHGQVVLTVPGRLRACFLNDRRMGLLSQVAFRTLRGYVQAALGEPDVVSGAILFMQNFGPPAAPGWRAGGVQRVRVRQVFEAH